ncbi:MAG: hypothetical protein HUK23_07070 [Sphaerochaetaceae bacterium]|nr:hypothetical protein [Sphaerochaetaceae bacterium]
MDKVDAKAAKQFYDAVLTLKNLEECKAFFEDVCTIREFQDLSQRLQVAVMLEKGLNYQEISKQTSVSSATISRVNRCLLYGEGGYRTVLDRMGKND